MFSRVPKWIGALCCIWILYLCVLRLVEWWGSCYWRAPLPSICRLPPVECPKSWSALSTGLFPVLEEIWFRSDEDVTACLSFEAGAMPKLQSFSLVFGIIRNAIKTYHRILNWHHSDTRSFWMYVFKFILQLPEQESIEQTISIFKIPMPKTLPESERGKKWKRQHIICPTMI